MRPGRCHVLRFGPPDRIHLASSLLEQARSLLYDAAAHVSESGREDALLLASHIDRAELDVQAVESALEVPNP